jgi:N-acetyl-gamma-glutamyl-phosphate reductase
MVDARKELAQGAKVIDYSGDFRFQTAAEYAEYANRLGKPAEHKAPDLLGESVYGVAELRREQIRKARLVGNPGCFAVGVEIGLAPRPLRTSWWTSRASSATARARSVRCGQEAERLVSLPRPLRQHERVPAQRAPARRGGRARDVGASRANRCGSRSRHRSCLPAAGILSSLYGTLRPGITPAQVMEAYRSFHRVKRFRSHL